MTAPIGMADFAATVTRPAFFPAATHPDPPIPALNGWEPPTIDDLGLTADPVAHAARLLTAVDELKARMTPQQLADLRQYEQRTHLKAVA